MSFVGFLGATVWAFQLRLRVAALEAARELGSAFGAATGFGEVEQEGRTEAVRGPGRPRSEALSNE